VSEVTNSLHYTVTHMTIARQRLNKHIPKITLSTTEGHPLLGKGPINTHSSLGSVSRNYKRAQNGVQGSTTEKENENGASLRQSFIVNCCDCD
jgi:hypothetical protein